MSQIYNLAESARLGRPGTLLSKQKQRQGQHGTDDKRLNLHYF